MDKKFIDFKNELLSKGLSEKNFNYLYDAVKSGTKKELILKNLTSDIRKVDFDFAKSSIEKMFILNGGEFKYENRTGYIYTAAYLIIAIACLLMLVSFFSGYAFPLRFVIVSALLFVFFTYKSIITISKSIRGKYRDE